MKRRRLHLVTAAFALYAASFCAQNAPVSAASTQHPALFLVGDSVMHTGTGDGSMGPWGSGAEIIPMIDATNIHVYNDGQEGRSSHGYIDEGAWKKVMDQLQTGDWVIVQFGHNDAANSTNNPLPQRP
jgi:lysophospholipase L1-like esterase